MNFFSSLVALVLFPSIGLGQFSFSERTDLLDNTGFGVNRCSSGVAMGVADFNGDGRDDLIRLHNGNLLAIEYQNGPEENFSHRFLGQTRVTPWALAIADVDKNGHRDFVLCPFGGGIDLYRANNTNTAYNRSQVPNSTTVDCQGTIFADLDGDGNIDLFSCHDTGDNGKWRNVGGGNLIFAPELMDTDLGNGSPGNYAALWTDYDRNGQMDLYLSKCSLGVTSSSSLRRINRLFRANENGSGFEDVAPDLGIADGSQTWSTDFGDIDNDGDLDLFILNHPEPNNSQASLLFENRNGTYVDITDDAGISAGLRGIFGIQTLFRDFDNDGFLDLIVTASDLENRSPTYLLFRNEGNRTFTEHRNVLVVNGTPLPYIQSLAVGDLNHDGFLDLYTGRALGFNSPTSLPDHLFLNDGNDHHFISFQLRGTFSNPDAIGARVDIMGPWGTQTREVRAGEGYGIQNSLTLHFGLSTETVIPMVRVTWPSGVIQEFTNLAANQFFPITETASLSDLEKPSITSAQSDITLSGMIYRYQIGASGLPENFQLTNQPAGMTVSSSGLVSWTPSTTGLFSFEVSASNALGSDTQVITLEVIGTQVGELFEIPLTSVTSPNPFPWRTQSVVTRNGALTAQSGSVGNNGISNLSITVQGPGVASFWQRVSSEVNFDFLSFSVNGQERSRISGFQDWARTDLNLPSGSHRLTWIYQKDESVNSGSDAGWLSDFRFFQDRDGDQLDDAWEISNFTNLSQSTNDDLDGDGLTHLEEWLGRTDPNNPRSLLQIAQITQRENDFEISWQGRRNRSYEIQASPSLLTDEWTTVSQPMGGRNGLMEFSAPVTSEKAFWRVVVE